MAELDLMNEQVKSRALNQFIQGSSQLKGSGEGFASLFGSGLNLLGDQFGQQGVSPFTQSVFADQGANPPDLGFDFGSVDSSFGLNSFGG